MKILEINTNPPVTTYNHHAFGTGIITTVWWGMNWVYNNYILLGFYPDEGPLTFDFYMDYIYCQPVFEREYLSDSIMAYVSEKPERIAKEQLEAGKYLECCVDEYFIPGREPYRTYHFQHNILLYGYDDGKKVFYTAGYDETGKYTTGMVTYKEFRDSGPNYLNILRLRSDLDFEIYPEYIQRQIMQYNGEAPLEPVGSYPAKGRKTGTDAVNALMGYIRECVLQGLPTDQRPVSILFNHRKLMNDRMKCLNEKGMAEKYAVDEASEQMKLCEMLKNRQLIYNIRGNDRDRSALLELTDSFMDLKLPNLR